MRLHVTYTGGTIGMVASPHGLVPGADLEGWLTTLAEGLPAARDGLTLTSLHPLIDSSNATPGSWQQLVDHLRERAAGPDAPDGFVVLHGTDTMAYTCAALSYALTALGQPVVVTGSQLPLGAPGSDAAANVTGALHAVAHQAGAGHSGVSLFFGGRLLAGNRATKSSAWSFTGFSSPAAAPLALAGAPWRWERPAPGGAGWEEPLPYRDHDVPVIDLVPGTTTARLRAALTPLPDAVLLRAFGVGNVPDAEPGLTDLLAEVARAGTAVLVTSQCHEPLVRLGTYAAGDAAARAGAAGTGDMTLEAAYAKVQFLLSQGLRGTDLTSWVGHSLAGEVTEQDASPE